MIRQIRERSPGDKKDFEKHEPAKKGVKKPHEVLLRKGGEKRNGGIFKWPA